MTLSTIDSILKETSSPLLNVETLGLDLNLPPRGAVVAISYKSFDHLMLSLIKLDGHASAIIFLSPSLDEATLKQLLTDSEAEFLLSDWIDNPEDYNLTSFNAGQTVDTTRWVLATSGTTNVPKLVSHTLASLTKTVKKSSRSSEFTWGQLYDNYRFAGLQVVLQAVVGGSHIIVPEWGVPLCQQLKHFSENNVNCLSATPTLWRKILMTEGSKALQLRSITLGGEIVDKNVLEALKRRFDSASIRHIYASTEAGAGFSVGDGLPGFPVSFLEDNAGPNMKIIDGMLYIQNADVKSEYLGTDNKIANDDGFIKTGDLVEKRGDRIYFLGREGGLINVGGNKVLPEVVEAVINAVNGVVISRVYGKSNSLTGELVMADVQLSENLDGSEYKDIINSQLAASLEPFQRPVFLKFVDRIKTSANGKVIR